MAINDTVSLLQSTSYTNKDFQSVYTELLDLVKEISSKWDPSISNESDPGVILLKLNAIIADKCNYNIDKNVLECFPLSVTQQPNARQLYEQLGYYMHWYESGICEVSMKYLGENDGKSYSIPVFTMITDPDSTVSYSILGNKNAISGSGKPSVGDFSIPTDGSIVTVRAIQGVAVNYDVDGKNTITIDDLDENRRLYFPTTNIAENGIFIKNENPENSSYTDWERKDNLLVEQLGNKYFKFGVTKDQLSCYIEFPEDASYLIGSGINIVYILSTGEDGNVAKNTLTQFMSNISVSDKISFNSDTLSMANITPSTGGKDPETINDAYNSYRRTIGTFDTLITLRDYINAIYNSELVSNLVVSDRTNDIQQSYDIVVDANGVYDKKTHSDITAFDIKLYALEYVLNPYYSDTYLKSFNVLSPKSAEYEKAAKYIEDEKAVNHDIIPFIGTTPTNSNFLMIRNKYPISCNVTPQYALSINDRLDLQNNVYRALRENLCSRNIDFGDKIDYEAIKKTILESDSRIKYVSLNNINYTSYAVTYDLSSDSFTEVPINAANESYSVEINGGGTDISFLDDGESTFIKKVDFSYGAWYFKKQGGYWYIDDVLISNQETIEVDNYESGVTQVPTAVIAGTIEALNANGDVVSEGTWTANSNGVITGDVAQGETVDSIRYNRSSLSYYGLQESESSTTNFSVAVPLSSLIRSEIFAKSVLAGNSYIYIPDTTFQLSYDKHEYEEYYYFDSSGTVVNMINLSVDCDKAVAKTKSLPTKIVGICSALDPNDISVTWYPSDEDADNETNEISINNLREQYGIQYDTLVSTESIEEDFRVYIYVGKEEFIIPSIDSIKTNVDINFSESVSNSCQYELRDGESLNFFYPNLIDQTKYSSGVRFTYAGSNVTKDTVKQLGNNEYIVFYWVSDNANLYTYQIYTEDTKIKNIKPNFNLEQSSVPEAISTIIDGKIANYEFRGTVENGAWIKYVDGLPSENKLTSSKTITTVAENTVKLEKPYLCYWITNDYVEKDGGEEYLLFSDDAETKRVLGSNEYFIYTNSSFSSYVVLGAGTLIERGDGLVGITLSVPIINISEINLNGISVITENGYWFDFSTYGSSINDVYFNTTEMEYLSIPSGMLVKVNYIGSTSNVAKWSLKFNSNGYIGSKYDLYGNKTNIYIDEFRIQYKDPENETESYKTVNIPSIIDPSSVFAQSLLSLDLSGGSERILLSNQSLLYHVYGDDDEYYKLTGGDKEDESNFYPMCLSSDLDIAFDGENRLSTYILNTDFTFKYLDLFVYKKSVKPVDDLGDVVNGVEFNQDDNSLEISVMPNGTGPSYVSPSEVVISTLLLAGNYVFEITYPNTIDGFNVSMYVKKVGGTNYVELGNELGSNSSNKQYFVYSLNESSEVLLKFLFSFSSSTEYPQFVVSVKNPYKYDNPEGLDDFELAFIKGKMQELCNPGEEVHYEYACTYPIPESQLIKNPLDSLAFFNKNHWCNSYTIPQVSATTVYV